MTALETRLKERAHALGFELAGIAAATPADGFDRLREWLARGLAGTMEYMEGDAEARREPSSILPEVRSVVMLGMNYPAFPHPPTPSPKEGEGEPEALAPPSPSLGEGPGVRAPLGKVA